ncbi:hypothetical protein GCM10009116_26250 [Brevundimonas basaltis]|uniref:Uncharacterized protein n=1 Tax=Brevundimonas basaltis TaxID=472166 RepID=A0A7W8HZ59_9CAUL|nr:hypothetical protein [Brevundimonas basaltis]MBB5291640.1 hypothetical protein [Brevundimonas basaltis]
MKRLIPLTSVLVLALCASSPALAQNGNGNGHGKGHGAGNPVQQDRDDDGDDDRREGRRNGNGRENRAERDVPRNHRSAEVRVREIVGDPPREGERAVRELRRGLERGESVVGREVIGPRRDEVRALLQGCPPGLAKKDNGCLPPGQARKIDRSQSYDRYNYLWRSFGGDGGYQYRDGYLYRTAPDGGLLGYLPVLGGILSTGNVWPTQYTYQQPPQYYSRYYGLNDRYQYRYSDGVLYGVDPKTQAIAQVAALLTGQQIDVGQRMPAGYDVYNIPYDYRDQYVDSADRHYRYSDGYVYQVDPTTRLVQAVIQLLT